MPYIKIMYGPLKIADLNAVWEGNLKGISESFCGSGHVIPKYVRWY